MNKPETMKKAEQAASKSPSNASDWGFAEPKPGRGSEVRIALLLVVCLLGALGFVMYRKFNERRQSVASTGDFQPVAALGQNDAQAGSGESPASNPNAADAVWSTPRASSASPVEGDPWFGGNDDPSGSDSTSVAAQPSAPAASAWTDPAQIEFDAETSAAQSEPQTASRASDSTGDAWDLFATPSAGQQEPQASAGEFVTDATDSSQAADTTFAAEPLIAESPENNDGPTLQAPVDIAGGDPFATETAATAATGDVNAPLVTSSEPAASPSESAAFDPFAGDGPTASEVAAESTPPRASPWGTDAPLSTTEAVTLSAPEPLPIDPADAQVIPVAAGDPFGRETTATQQTEGAQDTGWDMVPVRSRAAATSEPLAEFGVETTTAAAESHSLPSLETSSAVNDWPLGSATDENIVGTNPAATDSNPFSAGSRTTSDDPFTPAAAGVSHAINEDEVSVHVVQSGENFWNISQKHYGSGRYFSALAAYNQPRIADPQRMRPGMKVLVPDAGVLASRFPKLVGGTYGAVAADAGDPPGFFVDRSGRPMYRVGRGDTLSGIAVAHLGRASRWVQIYGMNRTQLTDANSLKTGMVLQLPSDASQVSLVPDTAFVR